MNDAPSSDPALGPLIQAASFSPDGRWLVTGSFEGTLALWDAANGRRLRVLLDPAGVEDVEQEAEPGAGGVEEEDESRPWRPSECIRRSSIVRVCVSADGRRLVAGAANGLAVLWNAVTWREAGFWRPFESAVTALAISPDVRWVATGCREPGTDTLRVWRLGASNDLPGVPTFSSDRMISGVFALTFSPDSRFVASGGWGFSGYSAPMIYELATGERVNTLLYDASRALDWSPDGARLATGDEFGTVSVWDLATRQKVFERKQAHGGIVSVVAFSPDGTRLISGSLDGSYAVFAADSGAPLDENRFAGSVLACRTVAEEGVVLVAEAAPGADHPGIHRLMQG